jgi:ankyrin repeat protein
MAIPSQKALNRALLKAAATCKPDQVKDALAAGAYINARHRSRTPLMYAILYNPKNADDAHNLDERKRQTVDLLLETPGIRVNLLDATHTDEMLNPSSGGNTALMLAVRYGYFAYVKRLLKFPTINVQCKNYENYNACMLAIRHSEYDIYRLFRKRNLYTLKDIHEGFIRLVGEEYPHEHTYKIIDELMAYPGFDINYKDTRGLTPLLVNIKMGHYDCEIIVRLLRHPKIDINIEFPHGETHLMRMYSFEEPLIVRLLLTFPTVNVLQPNSCGQTLEVWMKRHKPYEKPGTKAYHLVKKILNERIQSSIEVRAITEIELFSPMPYLPLELQKYIGTFLLKRDTFEEVLKKYPDTRDSLMQTNWRNGINNTHNVEENDSDTDSSTLSIDEEL